MATQDYYNDVYAAAKELGASDVQAHLAASQASLETGYGRSVKGNNHFGIKAGGSWKGPTTSFRTHEYQGGKRKSQTDRFRAFQGLKDSVAGYMSFMDRAFPDAWNASTLSNAIGNLTKGRFGSYATDPQYTQKVSSIARYLNSFSIA
jgi:flagellum-specific peptidoglycan hydrolase FlgJ